MACTLSVQHLIIIVLINSSSVPISARFTAASSDYEEAESLTEIETQIAFYPYQNVSDEKPLYSWKPKTSNSEEKIIIIRNQEKKSKNEVSQQWMSGALQKVKSTSSKDMARYYAQIINVRNDFGGILVELDKWSPKIVKNLVRRENEVEATNGFTIDTFLCAYETCKCDDDEDAPIIERAPLRPKRNRKKLGVATVLAYCRKGIALTTLIVKGKGGSRSVAFLETETAVSNIGVAQSSSKSRGGLIEAEDKLIYYLLTI